LARQARNAGRCALPYDPEVAWTTKTDWVDGRVRANLAVFPTNFDDLQVEQLDVAGLSLIIDNTGFCAHRWDRAGSDVAAGA